jgi:hypothetical protein
LSDTRAALAQSTYSIIFRNPGITENELRGRLGLDIPLNEDENCEDCLDSILADCGELGLLIAQKGDRLWVA